MQEQNFEEEVRRQLEELSFVPSAPVWKAVEAQIKEKRSRRRLVIFWLLPLLLLCGITVFYINKKDNTTAYTSKQAPHHKETTQYADAKKNQETSTSKDHSAEKTAPEAHVKTKRLDNGSAPMYGGNKNYKREPERSSAIRYNNSAIQQQANSVLPINENERTHSIIADKDVSTNSPVSTKDTATSAIEPAIVNVEQKPFAADTVALSAAEKEATELAATDPGAADSSPKPATAKHSKKTGYAFYAIAGVSGFSSSFLGIPAGERFDYVFNTPSGNTGSAQPGSGFSQPATLGKSFSFTAGAQLSKPVNDRFAVTAGLRYSYYSTAQNVGQEVAKDTVFFDQNRATAVEKFYLNSSSVISHTNRYHYIELPIGIEYRPFRKLPLLTGLGLSAGYLAGSNALHHNVSKNIYYQNNELLHKMSFAVFAQAAYRILSGKKTSLYAGPQAQVALRNLTTYNSPYTRHLYRAGIGLAVHF